MLYSGTIMSRGKSPSNKLKLFHIHCPNESHHRRLYRFRPLFPIHTPSQVSGLAQAHLPFLHRSLIDENILTEQSRV
jgi:hypothetical protein